MLSRIFTRALRGQPTGEERRLLRAVGHGAVFMLRHRHANGGSTSAADTAHRNHV